MRRTGRFPRRSADRLLDGAGASLPFAEATTPTSLPDWGRGSDFPDPKAASDISRPRLTDLTLSIRQEKRPGDLLTVAEVASRLRVSTKTIRRVIARGELHAVRIGRAVRIDPQEIERLIDA